MTIKELTKYARKPLYQLIVVLILLTGYWTWDIVFIHDKAEPQQEMVTERFQPSPYPESLQFHSDSASVEPESDQKTRRTPSGVSADDHDDLEVLEWKYKFWDMILGHLASILGSIVALAVPAYNFWKQRNKE